ncbi:MAG: aldolase [Caldilineaceae bacterium]|nr:aldolase [Caldilineaceae bacterium]
MKPNRFKAKRVAGQMPIGHMIMEFGTPNMAKLLESADVDFVIIDMEHSRFTTDDLASLSAWFKATEIAPFVRIPQLQYHFIARTLDLGMLGIMVPDVRTRAQAAEVVAAAKYAPMGDRGVALGGSATDFRSVNPRQFMDYANDNTTIICQIESVEGLANIEEIASVPGVDVLWVGHFDLTHSMGIPGQFDDPRFLEALQRVVSVAHRYGLSAGVQPRSLEQAEEWIAAGFDVISYGSDFSVYANALRTGVGRIRKLAQGI